MVTRKEMLEAIKRSGYIFEGEIINDLVNKGFFVESNKVVANKQGKIGEIDFVAEFFDSERRVKLKYRCFSNTNIVGEVKNTDLPLVLLNEESFSPMEETRLGIKSYVFSPKDVYISALYWEMFYENFRDLIHTQFCSFSFKQKKQNELMASHSDIIYYGIQKVVEYCESELERISTNDEDEEDEIEIKSIGQICYLPVLVISNELYELRKNKKLSLKKLDFGILRFNYHYNDTPSLAYVFIVTKKGFSKFLNLVLEIDTKLEKIFDKQAEGNDKLSKK